MKKLIAITSSQSSFDRFQSSFFFLEAYSDAGITAAFPEAVAITLQVISSTLSRP